MKGAVKILFKFYSDALEEWTNETIWAETINLEKGYYEINNIPFYAPFACNDLILAKFDEEEEMLTYKETIKFSGNSTIQVVLMESEVKIDELRAIFQKLNCETEN